MRVAARTLGASFRPLKDTFTDEVAWLRAAGLAPAGG